MMNITVVIPTWNRADRLVNALQSVSEQRLAPHEVIVVDDGSTDNTRAMVTTRFSDVRYIYQENGGVSRARNAGIRAATGDWIALLDSDDRWQPAKLERQVEALRQAPDFRVCHTDEIWIRYGRRVNPMKKHAKHGGEIFALCLPRCAMSPSAILLHREVLEQAGLFDESLPACEDYDLWLRICAAFPVLYIDTPLVIRYGGHHDQLSRRYWGMDRFRIRALEKTLALETLSADYRNAALQTLLQKLAIVIQGAEKRNNRELASRYRKKLDCYQQLEIAS
jgi:glycosyltransferase involved in cell wall biosynthesis